LRKRASKREAKLKRKKEKKDAKEGELHRVKQEAFTLNHLHQGCLLYFKKVVKVWVKKKNVEREVFEALKRVINVGKGLEKNYEVFKDNFHLLHLHL